METTTRRLERSGYSTQRTAQHRSTLEGSFDDFLLGEVNGLDIYVGINFGDRIDPAKNPHRFAEYSTQEMKGFQEYWSWWDTTNPKVHKKKSKPAGWGFGTIRLYAFANNIQIGNCYTYENEVELGYTPSANRIDTGELIWITPEPAILEWELINQDVIENFADDKRLEALTLFAESLEKLTK
jgi:hypothetical protein